MKQNYIPLFFRKIFKNKISSIINILGISLCVVSVTLILNYVGYEHSYDSFHEKSDRIYRINLTQYKNGELLLESARTDRDLGEVLTESFPEILGFSRLVRNRYNLITIDKNTFVDDAIFYADSSFFNIFDCDVIYGTKNNLLKAPNEAVLKKSISEKYFGNTNPVGKEIRNGIQSYIIVGVIEDFPPNSHLQCDILLSFHNTLMIPPLRMQWNFCDYYTYVLLDSKTSIEKIINQSPDVIQMYNGNFLTQNNIKSVYSFIPIEDIHFSQIEDELVIGNNIMNIRILIAIAIFVIIITVVNYNNLFVSVFLYNLKTVSLKKVFGISRMQLLSEMFIECFFMVFIGFIIGMISFYLISDKLNNYLLNINYTIDMLNSYVYWCVSISGIVLLSILLSIYPFWLSNKISPISIFRGKVLKNLGMKQMAKAFLTIQFLTTFFFLAGTFVVIKQVKYFKNFDSGLKLDNTIVVKIPSNSQMLYEKMKVFKSELEKESAIADITLASAIPGSQMGHIDVYKKNDFKKEKKTVGLVFVDDKYFNYYDIKLLKGNNNDFIENEYEQNIIVMNESAYKLLNYSDNEIMQDSKIIWDDQELNVVGVVKDFKITSLKYGQEPVIFKLSKKHGFDYCSIRYFPNRFDETIKTVKTDFENYLQLPFEFVLLKDMLNNQYASEIRFGRFFGLFTIVLVALSLIGIWVLSYFNLLKKQKDMAIRKVLGASPLVILKATYNDLFITILIAFILATPISYIILNKWIENFSYNITIGIWFFIIPLGIIVTISFLMIIFHVIKLIKTSPAHILRYE